MSGSICRGVLGAVVVLALGATGCAQPQASAQKEQPVERGKYLVTVGGCNDCHTPLKLGPKGPEHDMARMLSGHPDSFPIERANASSPQWLMTMAATGTAFSGPWGVSFAANLTPDRNTGLGIWTEEMFMKAMRTGRHMGASRQILPPMPWPNVGAMTDDDLKALYAYLRSIPPLHNRVPEPLEPPPLQTAGNYAAAPPGAAGH